jgi:hypothetical protein
MSARSLAAIALAAGVAHADQPPAAVATAPPLDRGTTPHGLAVGAELGDPSAITAAWFAGKLDVDAALGTATFESFGWAFHVDGQYAVAQLTPAMPLRVGLGLRYYRHSHLMSPDELPSSHLGVRASVAVALLRGPLEVYAELAPGVDVARGASCSLVDGAYSVCPHAGESPWFLEMAIGVRWFLWR